MKIKCIIFLHKTSLIRKVSSWYILLMLWCPPRWLWITQQSAGHAWPISVSTVKKFVERTPPIYLDLVMYCDNKFTLIWIEVYLSSKYIKWNAGISCLKILKSVSKYKLKKHKYCSSYIYIKGDIFLNCIIDIIWYLVLCTFNTV